ncbi:unannotated protein [freshwater metagenome]|uniref:Unannotated protein n=1 Tax=freshwater metagenome TaxID=449393 RepID=A0A6J7H6Y6_9ZZZZ|nr:hypothetical protein [Actinomycetota bacterium]
MKSFFGFRSLKVLSISVLALSIFSVSPSLAAPTNSVLPLISGNISVGATATVSKGTWVGTIENYSYQWRRCTDLVTTTTCVAISGANALTYVITQSDSGKYLRVSVTALDVSGGTTVLTAPTVIVLSKPVNTVLPKVTGTTSFGNILTTTTGTWSTPNAGIYSYKWLRCSNQTESSCVYISGATSSSYGIAAAEVGTYIRSEVTISDVTNRLPASAKSSPTSAISSEPRNTSSPFISGDPVVGQKIQYSPGGWVANPAATFTTVWQKCTATGVESCVNLSPQPGQFITLNDSDLNMYYRVQVTGVNNFGGTIKFSPVFGPIVKPTAPVNTKVPSITGLSKEGEIVTVDNGLWSGFPIPTYSYVWQRCSVANVCSAINSAITSTYKITYEDGGNSIKAIVKATNSVGSVSVTTNSITGIIGSMSPFLIPQVSGLASRGQTLESDSGIWAGTNTTDFLFKWQRCSSTVLSTCTDITGAQANKYQVAMTDQGKYLRSGVAIRNVSQYFFSDLSDRVPQPTVGTKYIKGKTCTVRGKKVTSDAKTLICRNVKGKLVWY